MPSLLCNINDANLTFNKMWLLFFNKVMTDE